MRCCGIAGNGFGGLCLEFKIMENKIKKILVTLKKILAILVLFPFLILVLPFWLIGSIFCFIIYGVYNLIAWAWNTLNFKKLE